MGQELEVEAVDQSAQSQGHAAHQDDLHVGKVRKWHVRQQYHAAAVGVDVLGQLQELLPRLAVQDAAGENDVTVRRMDDLYGPVAKLGGADGLSPHPRHLL